MRRLAAGLGLALLALVLLATPAGAHARLTSTSPAGGETLESAPAELVVRFNEGVQADDGAVRLHDGTGRRVGVGDLRHTDGGKILTVAVDGLDDGAYVLTWRVESLDGHPISGGVTWRVGSGAQVDPSLLQELLNAEDGDPAVSAAAAIVRGLLFASLLVLVGGLVFLLLIWPAGAADPRLVPLLRASVAVATLTTVLGMGLQGADVTGESLTHALSVGAVLDTVETAFGQAALLRLGALVLLGALVWRMTPVGVRRTGWRVGAQAAAVLVFASVGLGGHARTGRWAGLALPVDVLHLLAAATWIGGLAVLVFVVLRRDDELASRMAARFSSIAAVAVGVVVVTGAIQSFRQLDGLSGLRETNYGRLLALKVVAVAVVAVLGAVSRSLVRSRVAELQPAEGEPVEGAASPEEVRSAVRRSVAAEAAVAVVVVGLTSLLVAADPALAVSDRSFEAVRVVDTTQLTLVAAPSRTGPVDFHVYAEDPNFGLAADLEATASMSLPARDIPPIEIPLRYAGRGHWSAYDVDVAIAGDWRVEVSVVVSEFDQRDATYTVPID